MTDELLIKFLLNEGHPEEHQRVEAWLNESSSNQTYYLQLKKIWDESRMLYPKNEINTDVAWLKFKERVQHRVVKSPIKLKSADLRLRIAAILFLVLGSWGVYQLLKTPSYIEIYSQSTVRSAQLPDGSQLTLNRDAHVHYHKYFKEKRNLTLDKGEVFFKVVKDEARPFIISMDKIKVEVVGTSFNIKRIKDHVEVIVESGTVKVNTTTDEIILNKGEMITLNNVLLPLHKQVVHNQLYNYYRTRLFIADNTPLPILIDVLNKAYDAHITLDDSVKGLNITTTLKYDKSVEENLLIICRTLQQVKIKRNASGIMLSY